MALRIELLIGFLALLLLYEVVPCHAQPFSRDLSFSLNYDFNLPGSGRSIRGVIEHEDGKLLIYGAFSYDHSIARFQANGQPDQSFQVGGAGYLDSNIKKTDRRPDGYLVTHGISYLTKLNHFGQFTDPQFTSTTHLDIMGVPKGTPFFLADGKYLIGCYECRYPNPDWTRRLGLIRLLPSGHVDTTFMHNVSPDGAGMLLPYGQDRIMVGAGRFHYYDSTVVNGMCRIYLDGTLDTTFQSIFEPDWVAIPILVQPDNKIIVTGIFKIHNYNQELNLIRLNPDGSLDSTFNNLNGEFISAISQTSDGGFLVGASFTEYQGHPKGGIAKLDANGFIEPAYFTGSGFDSAPFPSLGIRPTVHSITSRANDQYYVTGFFNGFNGEAVQPIIRLNGLVANSVSEVAKPRVELYPNPNDGKMIVSYTTQSIDGQINIYDVSGRLVLQQQVVKFSQNMSLKMNHLKNGIYHCRLTWGDSSQVVRFVVE